ncbi:hypothetical protein PHO31112_03609 [Pandoraea horticolens]|uniref:Intracellular septation protein A n=1 Tax=Pandoraea horticolens TaxID=2508298 RepID=A0A5E4X2H9_9BURK|nr:hypothetical protein [Pandoraea horticolens]VVE30436.1 hypothetical protein PHO31112_03609 [Pandoraea horticolens]
MSRLHADAVASLPNAPQPRVRWQSVIAALAYPVLILAGISLVAPRYLALMLLVGIYLRYRRNLQAHRLLMPVEWTVAGGLAALACATALSNSELLLRCYPVAVNLGMGLTFAMSLRSPMPMVERIARLHQPDLPADATPYLRNVTRVWIAFFVFNGAAALATALWASREIWSLYNGGIAYVLIGLLFAAEWMWRRRMLARKALADAASTPRPEASA